MKLLGRNSSNFVDRRVILEIDNHRTDIFAIKKLAKASLVHTLRGHASMTIWINLYLNLWCNPVW